jgi:polyhydroxybutyrate depolymerase
MGGGPGGGASSRGDAGLPGDAGSKPDALGSDGGTVQTCPAGMAAPSAGNRKSSLQHGGKSRSYTVHVPSGLSAGKPLAVVFDLHGAGGSGTGQQGQSGWGTLADREKFLMVYPDGIEGYWNVDDTCCGTAGKQKIDDVGFLKAIIPALSKDLCIDAQRIYATGFSNGGGLAHRMGCDAADVIAAIAPMATDLRTQPCKPARPISMMEFRGTKDSLEPYEGGMVGPAGGQYLAVGAKASLKLWADIDQCTGTPTTIDKYCESYTTCQDGVEADLCSLTGVDHSPYGNSLNFNVAETAWKMFQRQPMK